MATKKKKKGAAVKENCRGCKFECPYPQMFNGRLTYFCVQVVENDRNDVRDWIRDPLNEFNIAGQAIGKSIIPCPGYEGK